MRLPRLVSIDITKQCNLKCLHCYNNSGKAGPDAMDPDTIRSVAKQIARMHPHTVCLCGGEPLLYEGLFELMDILHDGAAQISLVTNGLCVTEEYAAALKEHGLDTVQISLDGAFAWQHDSLRGTAGAFDRAECAVRRLKDAGIRQISVSMLPDRLTLARSDVLEEYVQLCCSLGVTAARFMPFISMGRGAGPGRILQADPEEMFRFQKNLERLKSLYAGRIVLEWDDPVRTCRYLCGKILEEKELSALCIMNNGMVKPDIYLPVKLGNVKESSLEDICSGIYDSSKIRTELERVLQSIHNLKDLEEMQCNF